MADELLLSIEKLLYGGDGLAHAEGNTVFVPFVLPGEQVRASVADAEEETDPRETGGSEAGVGGADQAKVPAFWGVRRLPLPAH